MSKVYSSNLTKEQWELIEPLIPAAKIGGRKREVDIWCVLNAIFYILTQGCTWRNLPGDFEAWQTIYTYFRDWRGAGDAPPPVKMVHGSASMTNSGIGCGTSRLG